MLQAEKTPPLVGICLGGVGEGVLDSFRIVLETDGKSSAGDVSLPDIPKRSAAPPEIQPRLFLLGQQIETKSREAIPSFIAVESGIGLLFKNGHEILFLPGSDDPPYAAVHLPSWFHL
jgi:hypothetical protein